MSLIYKPENNGKDLSDYDCLFTTGYTEEEIIGMTGADYVGNYNRVIIISGEYPAVRVKVKHIDFEFSRTLNFEEKIIYNEFFRVIRKGRGLGAAILKTQVDVVSGVGFEHIKLRAMGNNATIKSWNGYITWAKLGFAMEQFEMPDFITFMKKHNRNENSLYELLITKEGSDFWKENGYSWFGTFSLISDSESIKILNSYVNR